MISHGDFFGILWTLIKLCRIVYNKMNTEYRKQETEGYVIDYLLLMIDYCNYLIFLRGFQLSLWFMLKLKKQSQFYNGLNKRKCL